MANPVQQPLLDRFILDGEPLSREQLAPVWRDATNPEMWEIPIYEEFLRATRDVNLRLSPRATCAVPLPFGRPGYRVF